MMYEITLTVHWWAIVIFAFVAGVFFGKWLPELCPKQGGRLPRPPHPDDVGGYTEKGGRLHYKPPPEYP